MKTTQTYQLCILVLFFFFLYPNSLYGQTHSDSLGFRYFNKASLFNKEQKYDSALFYYKQASEWFRNYDLKQMNLQSLIKVAYVYSYRNDIDSAETILATIFDKAKELEADSTGILIDAYTLKARILCNYSEFEQAIHYMSNVLKLSSEYYGNDHIRTSSAHGNLGIVYSFAGQYDKTIYHCSKASDIVRKLYGEEHPQIASGYNTIGNAYLDLGNLDSAQVMHEKALNIRLKTLGKNHIYTAASYSNLSVVFYQKGDYQKALDYERLVFGIRNEIYGEHHPLTAQCYNNFGAIYEVTGNYQQALKYHLKALAIREASLPANHPDLAMSYMNLANVYRHSDEFDKALEYHNKALKIKTAIYGNYHIDVAQIINNIGDVYFRKGDYHMAIVKFTEAIQNLNIARSGKGHPDLANYENNLAESYIATNQLDSALQCVESAIRINSRIIPVKKNSTETVIFDQTGYLRSITLKARIYSLIYRNDNTNLNALDVSIREYKNAVDFMHSLRSGYTGDESKQWFSEASSGLFANAINMLYLKYQVKRDSSLLNELFQLMETGKYGILRESMTHKRALQVAGIPDSLVNKEKYIISKIRSCRAEILNLDTSIDTLAGQELGRYYKTLVGYEEEYDDFKASYAKNHPAYKKLISDDPSVSLKDICHTLDDNTAILEYTIADTSLYIQILKTEGSHLVRISIDSLFEKSLIGFLKSIKSFDLGNFKSTSNFLYGMLIQPVEHAINSKKHLIIIPDKMLLYLPFETLYQNWTSSEIIDFTKAPYLIKKYDIGYHYSANMFLNSKKYKPSNTNIPEGFIGFAPIFKSDSINGYILSQNKVILDTLSTNEEILRSVSINGNTWNELAFSEKEIRDIVTLFNRNDISAKGYFHSMANEQVFRKEAGNYKYIHIATHGLINETHPDLSGLILSQSVTDSVHIEKQLLTKPPEDDGILFSTELYDLDLNADLVVLSACETGIGKLVQGEGLISMTRGFLYAGIPNIIYSLWKVGDLSTHKLMVSFYNGLMQGMNYSKALQKAKLDMIQEEKYAYPLFWGGFTLIGPN